MTDEHNINFVQCQRCGKIYIVYEENLYDKSIIKATCPECGYNKGLNCGENVDDIYLYMNETFDPRYYMY